MQEASRAPPIVIFTLRLWLEAVSDEQSEWRGELKNLSTGEVRYIRLWEEVAQFIPIMLDEKQ